jgi:putative NADH-flavin reductase
MKNILLLGATGRTGRQILTYTLSIGYHVTALVRDPGKPGLRAENLTVIQGTPTEMIDIRKSIRDCDAVVSALNNPRKSDGLWSKVINPPTLMTDCMRNIITVMQEKGIKRIVVETAAGAGDSYNKMPLIMKWMIRYTNLKIVYADHDGQENLLINSDLDWTIVRPVGLNNKEKEMKLAIGSNDKHSAFVSRKAVAQFMVDCLETDEYLKKAPIISERK